MTTILFSQASRTFIKIFGDFIDSPDQVLTLALPAKLRVHNSLCDIQKVFFGFFGWVGYLGDEVTDVEIKLRVTSFEPIRARAFRTRFQLLLSALGLFGSASLFASFLDIDDGRPTDQRFNAGPVNLYGCLDLPSLAGMPVLSAARLTARSSARHEALISLGFLERGETRTCASFLRLRSRRILRSSCSLMTSLAI
jgi:hypothetical protein